MADAFSDAFTFLKEEKQSPICRPCSLAQHKLIRADECGCESKTVEKALQSSPHHMDEGLPESEMRHIGTMDRMNQRFGSRGQKPDERNTAPIEPTAPTSLPPNPNSPIRLAGTLPPNPARMPPSAGAPNLQESPQPIQAPNMPVSSKNPEGRISDAQLQALAAEFGIPYSQKAFKKAWSMLKALPEQQMFVERTRRENAGGDNEWNEYEENYDRPEIDRFGARSMGTVHPAILGMLQRRTYDKHQQGMPVNLNLDSGREDDLFGGEKYLQPSAGTSIAQGPEQNRRQYDADGQPYGNRDSEEISHNPDRMVQGGPFDNRRGGIQPRHSHNTGYGHQPRHQISHPTQEELGGY